MCQSPVSLSPGAQSEQLSPFDVAQVSVVVGNLRKRCLSEALVTTLIV